METPGGWFGSRIFYVLISGILLLSGSAKAHSRYDVIGAACIPDATSAGLYASISGGVGHASGQTSTITLHCPISNAADIITTFGGYLKVLYTDNSSTASNKVVVTLYKMSKSTAALTVVVTVSSDATPGCGTGAPTSCQNHFTENIDADNYYYFLGVYIARTSTSNTEIFWAATVDY